MRQPGLSPSRQHGSLTAEVQSDKLLPTLAIHLEQMAQETHLSEQETPGVLLKNLPYEKRNYQIESDISF